MYHQVHRIPDDGGGRAGLKWAQLVKMKRMRHQTPVFGDFTHTSFIILRKIKAGFLH